MSATTSTWTGNLAPSSTRFPSPGLNLDPLHSSHPLSCFKRMLQVNIFIEFVSKPLSFWKKNITMTSLAIKQKKKEELSLWSRRVKPWPFVCSPSPAERQRGREGEGDERCPLDSMKGNQWLFLELSARDETLTGPDEVIAPGSARPNQKRREV